MHLSIVDDVEEGRVGHMLGYHGDDHAQALNRLRPDEHLYVFWGAPDGTWITCVDEAERLANCWKQLRRSEREGEGIAFLLYAFSEYEHRRAQGL